MFATTVTGLTAVQKDISAISNNIANVGSVGYKKSAVNFGDIYSASSAATLSTTTIGMGVRLSNVVQKFTQGSLENTGNVLDLSLLGNGYFAKFGTEQSANDGVVIDASIPTNLTVGTRYKVVSGENSDYPLNSIFKYKTTAATGIDATNAANMINGQKYEVTTAATVTSGIDATSAANMISGRQYEVTTAATVTSGIDATVAANLIAGRQYEVTTAAADSSNSVGQIFASDGSALAAGTVVKEVPPNVVGDIFTSDGTALRAGTVVKEVPPNAVGDTFISNGLALRSGTVVKEVISTIPATLKVEEAKDFKLTRDGRFSLDSNGCIRDSEGCFLSDVKGNKITVPQEISITGVRDTYTPVSAAPEFFTNSGIYSADKFKGASIQFSTTSDRQTDFNPTLSASADQTLDKISIVGDKIYKGLGASTDADHVGNIREGSDKLGWRVTFAHFNDSKDISLEDIRGTASLFSPIQNREDSSLEENKSIDSLYTLYSKDDNMLDQTSVPFNLATSTNGNTGSELMSSLEINLNGQIKGLYGNGLYTRDIGQIGVAIVPNSLLLKQLGMGDYRYGLGDVDLVTLTGEEGVQMQSGTLERANVDITGELVDLITAQARFQANSKAYEASADRVAKILDVR